MAKKIGVIIDFLNDKYERQLNAAAAKYGYEIEYFPSSAEAVGRVDDCEILYGHCSQKVIRSAKSLKWYCCCWAGVDHFCDESLYPADHLRQGRRFQRDVQARGRLCQNAEKVRHR